MSERACHRCGRAGHIARECTAAEQLKLLKTEGKWQEYMNTKTRRRMFFNTETQKTTFNKPEAFKNDNELERDRRMNSKSLSLDFDERLDAQDIARREGKQFALVEEEVTAPAASLDTKIGSTNKGYQMMLKMGWNKSKGLGKKKTGIVEPVRLTATRIRLVSGKRLSIRKCILMQRKSGVLWRSRRSSLQSSLRSGR